MNLKALHVVGARPNFMKAAAVWQALASDVSIERTLTHTAQHYDANMSVVFISELGLPTPEYSLEGGSSTHATQTADIVIRFEQVITNIKPDWVMVYGDV